MSHLGQHCCMSSGCDASFPGLLVPGREFQQLASYPESQLGWGRRGGLAPAFGLPHRGGCGGVGRVEVGHVPAGPLGHGRRPQAASGLVSAARSTRTSLLSADAPTGRSFGGNVRTPRFRPPESLWTCTTVLPPSKCFGTATARGSVEMEVSRAEGPPGHLW